MANMTDKQYNTKLNAFIKSSTTQRDNCQVLIVEGIQQYIDNGRTTRLSTFLSKSVAVKSIPTVTIKDFIKEHTNLKYAKNKAGEYMFIKDGKSTNANTLPTINWYDWKKAKHNKVKEVDYCKRLTTDVKKALEKGTSKQDMLNAVLAGGLTTKDILNLIDSIDNLQLKAA
jgi:hypothetical protein